MEEPKNGAETRPDLPTPDRATLHGVDAVTNWSYGEMQPGTKPNQSLNGTERSVAQQPNKA